MFLSFYYIECELFAVFIKILFDNWRLLNCFFRPSVPVKCPRGRRIWSPEGILMWTISAEQDMDFTIYRYKESILLDRKPFKGSYDVLYRPGYLKKMNNFSFEQGQNLKASLVHLYPYVPWRSPRIDCWGDCVCSICLKKRQANKTNAKGCKGWFGQKSQYHHTRIITL